MQRTVDMEGVTREAEARWAADAAIRAEFSSKESYLAFRRAEVRGGVRTLSGRGGAQSIGDVSNSAKAPATSAPTASSAEAEWAADAAIRAEFPTVESYAAYRRASAAGRVHVTGSQRAPAQLHRQAAGASPAAGSLAERQALARQENVGRQFAGLPLLDIPQE